jgi:hypothetical protein
MVPKAKAGSSKKKDKDKDEDEILDMDDADDHDGDPSDLEAIAAIASTAKAKKIASKDVGDTTATGENGTPEISRPEVEAPFGFTKAGRPRKRPGPAPGTKRGPPRPVSLSPPRFDDNGELMPRRSPTPEPLNPVSETGLQIPDDGIPTRRSSRNPATRAQQQAQAQERLDKKMQKIEKLVEAEVMGTRTGRRKGTKTTPMLPGFQGSELAAKDKKKRETGKGKEQPGQAGPSGTTGDVQSPSLPPPDDDMEVDE